MVSLGVKLTRPLLQWRLVLGTPDAAGHLPPSAEGCAAHIRTPGVGTTTVADRPSRLARLCSQLSAAGQPGGSG
jgi:hypothetical protein